jgi:hypothetical protein
MFSVLAEGPGRYRLEDGTGAEAGWIRGRSIGFRGLRSEAEAIVAASAGWRTLQSALRRERSDWPIQTVDWEHLRFVHDGAYEWVSDGLVPLARLHRTTRVTAHDRDEVGTAARADRRLAVEFLVPSSMDEDAMIPLAHALWHTLTPLLGETSRSSGTIRHASRTATRETSPDTQRRIEHVHRNGFNENAVARRQRVVAELRQRSAPFPPDGGSAA